ncbi:MAG: YjbQ family protein, partial [Sphaerochaetaceae bacterium]
MYHTLTIQTQKDGFYDLTGKVRDIVASSKIESGICVIYSPHTSCGITINENADPDVQHDLKIAYT